MVGVRAHHLYAGAVESMALLLCLRGALHGVFELVATTARSDLAARERLDGAGLRKSRHGGGELRLRQLEIVADASGLDRRALLEDGLGHALDHVHSQRAAREETTQAEILGAVEENGSSRL